MTKAEKEEAARKYVCPRCHQPGERACRAPGARIAAWGDVRAPGKPMKTIHAERLALVGNEGEAK